jgi:hypothetical protein
MIITPSTKIRFALLTTFATAGVVGVVACGGGDDSSSPTDAGRADATTVDGGHTTGPEAGLADTGTFDAGDAAPADILSCAATHYLYCEDFEAVDAGVVVSGTKLGQWSTGIGGKTDAGQTAEMSVDTVKPFSGTYALHVNAPAGESTYGQLSRATDLDAGDIGPNMFGRMMIYFSDSALPGGSAPLTDSGTYGVPSGVHAWTFASSGHSAELDASVSMNIVTATPKLGLNYSPGDYGPGSSSDAGPVIAGAWHCLQWQYDGSGSPADDIANVWIDGFLQVHTDPTIKFGSGDAATPLKMASDWTQLTFGFTHYQTTHIPQDVYFDDFAIDNKAVPCPAITQ